MYDRGAWFVKVMITSRSRALCCLPSVKKQKHDSQVCFVDRAKSWKNSWRQGLTKHKKVHEGGKGAVCWLREREKLREPEEKKKFACSLRPGTKECTCGKWFVGYKFGINDGAELKFDTHKEIVLNHINIVLISHVICHVTILLKIVDYWPIGCRFKKRNRAITFF